MSIFIANEWCEDYRVNKTFCKVIIIKYVENSVTVKHSQSLKQ